MNLAKVANGIAVAFFPGRDQGFRMLSVFGRECLMWAGRPCRFMMDGLLDGLFWEDLFV